MAIPVFVSRPNKLLKDQSLIFEGLSEKLVNLGLEVHTVGQPYDVALENPLKEVRTLARHCSGGLILGFIQSYAAGGKMRKWDGNRPEKKNYRLPTPWNQLETGILFGLDLPLLVLRERGVTGGIFDSGAADVFVRGMPTPDHFDPTADAHEEKRAELSNVLTRWSACVYQHYYGSCR